MPSYASLQAHQQHMTACPDKHTSKNDTQNETYHKELRKLYQEIQQKERLAPYYLSEPSFDELKAACALKKSASQFGSVLSSLHAIDDSFLFSQKSVYSSEPSFVSVRYLSSASKPFPTSFHFIADTFASPQVQLGHFLPAKQNTSLQPGNYSFDIITQKLHYELQFLIQEHDTNEGLQRKIARLINQSDIGLQAAILEDDGLTALQLSSTSIGTPVKLPYHFKITEEGTAQNPGLVSYLGLNESITPAQNAQYSVNDEIFVSYTNTFEVFHAYELTLHPEADASLLGSQIEIGLCPDQESMTHNITAFVNSYNSFLQELYGCCPNEAVCNVILKNIRQHLYQHKQALAHLGISLDNASAMHFAPPQDWNEMSYLAACAQPLQEMSKQIMAQLENICLDPLSYFRGNICSYVDPETPFVNPYVTSSCSGLMFQDYC